jgi:hypothetical protein
MRLRLLAIYLNDHRAAGLATLDLARRCWSRTRGEPLGDDLQQFIREQREDCDELEELMDRLGLPRDRLKASAARLAERIGRLKLNGQLVGYSDLSRLIELDGLCLAVEAKIGLWRNLHRLAQDEPALDTATCDRLAARGTAQRALFEPHRLAAASRALH